jgi:hypothetical protein
MKTSLKTILVGTVLVVVGMAMARGAADPIVGTWNLNIAKSTFDPGPAPKSETRTYTVDKDGTTLNVSGVGADGTAISQQATFKYDGKAYPMTGAADFDALVPKQINGTTVKSTLMKAGKKVGTATRTISNHGKMLTLSSQVTGADGKLRTNVLVFDKQ